MHFCCRHCVVAWIEIYLGASRVKASSGRHCVVAWIEISNTFNRLKIKSSPLRSGVD